MAAKVLPGPSLAEAKALIDRSANWGRVFWKPYRDRVDYGIVMYLLLDAVQQLKPLGYRRFISNAPRTAIDTGVNILTRNDPFWRIDMPYGMGQEEREQVGKIERALAGVVEDLDEMFTERGDGGGGFWRQAAFYALMHGAIWGKFQVTKTALDMGRKSPLLGEFWDPRFVYPNYDGIGLQSIVVEKQTTVNEMFHQYGEKVLADMRAKGTDPAKIDPNSPAVKVEYWSNNRPGKPGWAGVLGFYASERTFGYDPISSAASSSMWLIEPYYHGYMPDELPVVGLPVNGIPLKTKPQYGSQILASMTARSARLGLIVPTWHDPSGWVADWGRGLLTSVEELQPQYNELIATIFQHFTIGTYPTWVFQTQTGELPHFEDGINAKVPLRLGERVEQLTPAPINQDAYRLVEILREEQQRGTLDAILQAQGGLNAQSGVVLQQNINAALNNLNPFGVGLTSFGSMWSSHILGQLRRTDVGTLSLVARGGRSYFRIEFDPKTDLQERKYKPIPIFRPSVPEDLLLKAQVARLLLDPRMPIMSVITVLDKIFQLEDPEGETKRMLEDVANRDSVILLERIAQILEEEGEPEMAERIRQREFQSRFAEQAQMLELQAQVAAIMQQLQGAGAGAGGAGPGGGPEGLGLMSNSGSPGSTGAGQPRPGQGGAPVAGGDMSALGIIGGPGGA